MIYTDKIKKAVAFASKAHKDQKRKILGYPYISHPLGVMFIVSSYTKDEDVLVASVLHDTVEDTNTTMDEIENIFGKKVRDIVYGLTDDQSITDKKLKHKLQVERLIKSGGDVLLIKLADIITNSCDIVLCLEEYPVDKYIEVFGGNVEDKIKMAKERLDLIEKAWEENPLLGEAWQRFEDYKNALKRVGLVG